LEIKNEGGSEISENPSILQVKIPEFIYRTEKTGRVRLPFFPIPFYSL